MGLSSAIEAGSAFVKLIAQDGMSPVFDKVGKGFENLGGLLTNTGGIVAAAGASIITPLLASAAAFAANGSALDDMANRTGIAGERLSALRFAATQSGTSLEKMEGALIKQTKLLDAAGEGNEKATKALDGLGLSIEDLQGLAPDEQFAAIGQKLSEIPDQTTRSAAAMDIWGKSANELLPIFADGVAGLNELTGQAAKLGLVMKPEDIANAAKLGDTWDVLTDQGTALVNTVGAAIAPSLINLMELSQPLIASVIEWVGANGELITTVAAVGAGLLTAGGVLIGTGTAFTVIGVALGGIGTAVSITGAALAAIISPIGLVAAGVVGLAAYFIDWQATLGMAGEGISTLWGTASEVFGGITSLLMAGDWQGAMDMAVAGLQVAWELGLTSLNGLWIDFKQNYLGHIPEFWTAMQTAWDFIKGIWDTGVGFVQSAWTATVSFLTDQWAAVSSFIADTFGKATSVFGEDNSTMADYVYDFAKICRNAWAGLETAWNETVTFMGNVWTSFSTTITSTWATIVGSIAGGLVRIAGAVGVIDDVKGTLGVLTEDLDRAQKARGAAADKAMSDRLEARNKRAKEIEDSRLADIAGIESRKQAARTEGAGLFDKQRADNDANRKAATDKLADLMFAAKLSRLVGPPESPAAAGEGGRVKGEVNPFKEIKAPELVGRLGTFNAAAARGLGVSSAADRTAKATERTAEGVEKILDKGGITYDD